MKQDEYSTAYQLWNAGATEVEQLNPGLDLIISIHARKNYIWTTKMLTYD